MARYDSETDVDARVTGWVGWVYFAAFMMCVVGVFQIILGLTALLNDTFYVAAHGTLLVADYTTWGWIHLVLGLVILMAGTSLFSGKFWAQVVGILLAGLSLVVQFSFLGAYPVWSLIMIAVDVLIIYALTVHGDEVRVG